MKYTIILSALAALAAAAPTLSPRNEDIYATFYNDDSCTQNKGIAVNVRNPGCLNESGRRSIYFQGGFNDSDVMLVESPGQNCPCQSHCDPINLNAHASNPFCLAIDLTAYQSVRFVGGTRCSANNC
ncbi:uncharacterized protein K489DRAFT_370879 [Dissoconium aciculare CBS 342.82]|jgi:hypothetical protein|uniref:Uncharacterized protein n=1 Tax=Dissoconium aciculare CBS 342.82 TaxID=1314786 RepID=A0A6J3M250_9PEZI|nr:uncharacterized protein K489DRAFT_370879 [Dissoconium aciculare CBS 342.82]KAF1821988.1 hypothetical protein K489DRAFT_370879 [Dissoconium aciculare CBS 342.82]